MTDLGVVIIPDANAAGDLEPVTFTLAYVEQVEKDGEKSAEPRTQQFTARGTLPYGYLVDYWSTPAVAGAGTRAAMTFFRRAIVDDDWPRFFDIVTDPTISAPKDTLEDLLERLLLHYETVDPTPARSGGPKKSAGGRQSTGRGSSRSRSAKASTSR